MIGYDDPLSGPVEVVFGTLAMEVRAHLPPGRYTSALLDRLRDRLEGLIAIELDAVLAEERARLC